MASVTDFRAKLAEKRLNSKLDKMKHPSLNPRHVGPKKEELPPPNINELAMPFLDRCELRHLILEHANLTKAESALKAEKEKLTLAIKKLCKIYSLESFMVGETRATYYRQDRATIKKELLLAANVSPKIIATCTVVTTTNAFKTTGKEITEQEEQE